MASAESRQPSWNELLDAASAAALRGVHTAMLGKLKSYSSSAQTAVVELATELPRASGEYAAVPPIEGPVLWPGAWAAGDRCLVVFLEESAAKWLETGSVEPPDFQMRHGLHPVVLPFPSIEGQSTDFVALKTPTESGLKDLLDGIIAAAGSVTAPGGGPAFVAALNAFKATYVPLLSVGTTKVKAR